MSNGQVAGICTSAPFHEMASTKNDECLLQEQKECDWKQVRHYMFYSRISVEAIRSHVINFMAGSITKLRPHKHIKTAQHKHTDMTQP